MLALWHFNHFIVGFDKRQPSRVWIGRRDFNDGTAAMTLERLRCVGRSEKKIIPVSRTGVLKVFIAPLTCTLLSYSLPKKRWGSRLLSFDSSSRWSRQLSDALISFGKKCATILLSLCSISYLFSKGAFSLCPLCEDTTRHISANTKRYWLEMGLHYACALGMFAVMTHFSRTRTPWMKTLISLDHYRTRTSDPLNQSCLFTLVHRFHYLIRTPACCVNTFW